METDFLLIIQCVVLLMILGYILISLTIKRLKNLKKSGGIDNHHNTASGEITALIQNISNEKQEERIKSSAAILDAGDEDMTHIIPFPPDIILEETAECLLIKGSVESISGICDEFASMEQLPEGYCMRLGEWRFFAMEDIPQSSRENKIIVMPADHWLFMSCKLRESINGYETHPYNYNYEPFTFKIVLEYGIGVEATDWVAWRND